MDLCLWPKILVSEVLTRASGFMLTTGQLSPINYVDVTVIQHRRWYRDLVLPLCVCVSARARIVVSLMQDLSKTVCPQQTTLLIAVCPHPPSHSDWGQRLQQMVSGTRCSGHEPWLLFSFLGRNLSQHLAPPSQGWATRPLNEVDRRLVPRAYSVSCVYEAWRRELWRLVLWRDDTSYMGCFVS